MAEGFKYGLLLVAQLDGPTICTEIAPGVWAHDGSIASLVLDADVSHWREWVGSLEWEALTKTQLMVDTRVVSARAEVMDGDNQLVEARLARVRRGLLLAGPAGFVSGETRILSGEAEGRAPTDHLRSIRRLPRRGQTIVRPYCCSRETFWTTRPRNSEEGWLNRWRDAIALLAATERDGVPPLLFFGLLAFERSFESFEIEFKIPDCVRATEAILGLPRGAGGGQNAFADRVLALVPELEQDWYVGGSGLRERLVQLYVHRNECVHGKVPFGLLVADGRDGPEEAARFDYLAETVARAVLLRALRHPNARAMFSDRAALEAAWTEKWFSGSFAGSQSPWPSQSA